MAAWRMGQTTRAVLLCMFAITACHSAKERPVALHAGDASQAHTSGDGAIQDGAATAVPDGGMRANDAAHDGASDSGSDTARGNDGGRSGDGATVTPAPKATFVYVGGYGSAYPFHTYLLNRTSGALVEQGSPTNLGDNPTFIAPSKDHRFLYLALESDNGKGGVVTAARNDAGIPTKLQLQPADQGLVFTSIDPSGKYVLAASYNGGFVKVYPIQADATLRGEVDTESFAAPSGASSAQTHSVRVHPSGKWAYVPNKALDKVAQFSFDTNTGKLTALPDHPFADCPGGPRHVAFNSTGSYVFVATEVSSELVSLRPGDDGVLSEIDRASTLATASPDNTGAHVLVHPNDKFVYSSNRGDDSIAVFAIAADGKLTRLQNASTVGKTPRNFDIDSSGAYLIAANQGDGTGNGSLVVFAIGDDGKLTQRGSPLSGLDAPAAVSIVSEN